MRQKPEKSLKPWQMGTHLRVLSESYPINTNTTGFRWFSKIVAFLCCGYISSLSIGRVKAKWIKAPEGPVIVGLKLHCSKLLLT